VADTWTSQHSTLGSFCLVVDVPRGPVMGCHVAPCGWLVVYVKVYGFHRGRTPDLSSGLWTGRTGLTARAPRVFLLVYGKNIFEV
jgi:hypothetical protein